MSYKALLFCPDEKTARAVTQVLSELDFAVERSGEPFGTVKRLTDQHFDALVVDCQNEQDASLLFRSARNSSFNHSSLSVAVVEGQAGVAKAFRIGANLVLTKPVNIEQSKSTLRVARGLLKKSEAKTAAGSNAGAPFASTLFVQKPAASPAVAAASAASSPFSALELEKEEVPTAEAAEAAVLESLPDPIKPAAPVSQVFAPALKSSAEPIAASTAGHAGAAAAPAMARIPLEIKPAPPMATQEPIVNSQYAEAIETVPVAPSFSSYGQETESGEGKKILAAVAVILLLGGALGYLVLRKPQLFQNLHRSAPAEQVQAPAPEPAATTEAESTTAALPAGNNFADNAPAANFDSGTNSAHSQPKPLHAPPIETIEVDPSAANQDADITVEAKPLVVNMKGSANPAPNVAQAAPAPPPISSVGASDRTLANLVTTNEALPKPAPASVRVSQGVSQGLLIRRVSPVYPSIALQLRKQGSVDLLAKISKDGDITGVQVLSGDSMLAKAAADAVRQWKYRPYLLNGLPVEIETQITVNFKLPQ